MNKTVQDRKEEREKKRVQRVLDCHNKKYGAHVEIIDKAINVYVNLREQERQLHWDWVCRDTETSEEIAVEVKRLTDPRLEEMGNVIWQILVELKDGLSGKLPGTFHLHVDTPKDYHPPLKGKSKREFSSLLSDAICATAQSLRLSKGKDLKPQITKKLPFILPDGFHCNLHKISNEDSVLTFGSGQTGWKTPEFTNSELTKFGKLVSSANQQLQKANTQETFLVLIEEGYQPIDPPEIAEAFKNIDTKSYSEIRHVYFVRVEQVAEIPLPTP